MTKKEMYALIITATANAENADEIKAFCEHETELLSRKGSKSGKPTKKQEEQNAIMEKILELLRGIGHYESVTAIAKASNEFSSNRVVSMLAKLRKEGKAVRVFDKKRVLFGLPEWEVPAGMAVTVDEPAEAEEVAE